MPQTIAVVDENGSVYHPTYAKRARGLVKSGRARWLNENCICLACPPDREEHLEENVMTENVMTECPEIKDSVSLQQLMEQLVSLQKGTEQINYALEVLFHMEDGDSGDPGAPGNLLGQQKAAANAEVVKCRATTNKMLLGLYEKMYDDLMRQRGMQDN